MSDFLCNQNYTKIFSEQDSYFLSQQIALVDYLRSNESLSCRFGHALAAFDLDMDKKEDLVVGAPLEREEGSEERRGAIYIFYGNDELR